MIPSLALPAALRAQLAQEAKAAHPRECCGLIEGLRDRLAAEALALHPTPNRAHEPDSFEIDPVTHIALLRGLRGTRRDIIGCYHSHPNGLAEPSLRDIAGAGQTDFLWLIASLETADAEPTLACFNWTGAAFVALYLEIR